MASDAKVRRYTVTNRGRWASRELPLWARRDRVEIVPEIRLSGLWLGRAGFIPGCRLDVAVEQGRLVVTIVSRPRPLPCRRCSRKEEEEEGEEEP